MEYRRSAEAEAQLNYEAFKLRNGIGDFEYTDDSKTRSDHSLIMSAPHCMQPVMLEDNQATIRIMESGKSPAFRHTDKTQRINLGWVAEQFRRKHYDLAYISTLLQSADILTKPFTNIDKWKRAVFLIGHIHVKPSRPASAVIESDYTPPRRSEPKYDGIIIEWGHDQASSLLGRADEASIGNQLIVRVTHGMDLNNTQTNRDLLKVVRSHQKNSIPITVWVDLRFAGGPNDRKEFGKLWSSFVNLSTGLNTSGCKYVIIAPSDHFAWKMDRVIKWCSNHECVSFELIEDKKSDNVGHWRVHTSHQNFMSDFVKYVPDLKFETIVEPKPFVRPAAVAVQVALSEDQIASTAVMASSSLPVVSLEERKRRIEVFRRSLKDPNCLAEAMAFEEPAYFKDAYGVVKEAYQYKLVEPTAEADPNAKFIGRITNGEWLGLRKQYPAAGFPLLYEMWHRHFNTPANQGLPIEGFESHGDSLLTEWTELVKSYLRDIAFIRVVSGNHGIS